MRPDARKTRVFLTEATPTKQARRNGKVGGKEAVAVSLEGEG
jgi:hypothetical protein